MLPAAYDVHCARLENGLELFLLPAADVPLVAVSVWYRVGSRHDPPGHSGMAHLLEHMLYKGSARYPRGEYDRRLHAEGAVHNASTWFDRTQFAILLGADRYRLALELEADRMRGALLSASDVRDEIGVVLHELQAGRDEPGARFFEELHTVAWPRHPYGRPVAGWAGEVAALDAAALRRFYDDHYWPDNAYLVIAGDFEIGRMQADIDATFGSIRARPGTAGTAGTDPATCAATAAGPQDARDGHAQVDLAPGERRFELRRVGGQEEITFAYRVPGRADRDAYALDLLAQLLGHGRTSRLYRALVAPGHAVHVAAENMSLLRDPYFFCLDVEPVPGVPATCLEALVEAEIARLGREPVAAAELASVCKRVRADFILRSERLAARTALVGELEASVGWTYLSTYLERLAAVTPHELLAAARRCLQPDRRVIGHYRPRPAPVDGGQ